MRDRPSARIQVRGPGDRKWPRSRDCNLDKHIRLDHDRIQASFPKHLSHGDLDLLTLVGAVAYADRTVRRRRIAGWGRDLVVSVPVWNFDFWTQRAVKNAVQDCLALLTGDVWRIEFTQLAKPRPLQPSLCCDHSTFERVSCVIPYSGGLDSLAGLQIWQAANPDSDALRIGTETNRETGEIIRRSSQGWEAIDSVSVKLGLKVGSHAESTYRTRTFVFFTTAALAAKLAGVPRVVVMENGQGALGPSLVPLGDEWPYRSTHPLFTTALRRLFVLVWGDEAPVFEHPHIWKTKAEVLREAASVDDTAKWEETHSCSTNPRRIKGAGVPRSCGLCGGCILRRSALVAAGYATLERREEFVWKDLKARTLEESGSVPVSDNDRAIARTNILNMRHLAELPTDPPAPAVLRVADEVAGATEMMPAEALAGVRRLVAQHRSDWAAYVRRLGKRSWVADLGWPQP